MNETQIIVSGAIGNILFGAALVVAARFLGAFTPREHVLQTVVHVIGCVFIIIGVLGLTLLTGVGAPLVAFATVAIVVLILVRRRIARRRALLRAMGIASARNVPLAAAVAAYGEEVGGVFGHLALSMAHSLHAGLPLSQAARRYRRLLPSGAELAVRLGESTGAMNQAIRELTSAREPAGEGGSLSGAFLYVAFVLMSMLTIVTFVMVRIVPQFKMIFAEFAVELPAMTEKLIETSDSVIEHSYLALVPILVFAALVAYARLHFLGRLQFDLPGTGWLTKASETTRIFRGLALAAEHDRPIGPTLQLMADSYPNGRIRRRLLAATNEVGAGTPWPDALLRHGLATRADAGLLSSAERVGNLPWALKALAENHQRRVAYRLQALLRILGPLSIVALGIVVGFIVIALFMPLISLISKLSSI